MKEKENVTASLHSVWSHNYSYDLFVSCKLHLHVHACTTCKSTCTSNSVWSHNYNYDLFLSCKLPVHACITCTSTCTSTRLPAYLAAFLLAGELPTVFLR